MNHEELSELLRTLPRETASTGFTSRVMGRTRTRGAAAPRLRFATATALVAILVMVSVAGARMVEHRETRVRTAKMRAEQLELRKELDQLKAITKQAEPVIYVGSSGAYDVVLDVSKQKRVTSTSVPIVFLSDDGSL